MAILAIALATIGSGVAAHPMRISGFDLGTVSQAVAEDFPDADDRQRRRYLLPEAELPTDDGDGIELRWKLRKIKLKMPLPSI